MDEIKDMPNLEVKLPPWYTRIQLIHTQITSAVVFLSCLIIEIFNFYLSLLIFSADSSNYFAVGLCLISIFTGISCLLGIALSRVFSLFDVSKRLWKIISINFVLSFITLGVVHIYFAATISAYKSSVLSELSDPSSCENSETFTSLSMVYYEADSSGCRGDLTKCSCYQQGKCFQGMDKDISTVKNIEKTFKCGGICVYNDPVFYDGDVNDSCIDQIHDAIDNAGIICCLSLALGATFCFLCIFSVCFMAFYKKKPLYTLKPHRNINESSIWELMQSHFTDKTIGTINTRRQFIHDSPPSNPSPSPIDVPDDDKTDENILEE